MLRGGLVLGEEDGNNGKSVSSDDGGANNPSYLLSELKESRINYTTIPSGTVQRDLHPEDDSDFETPPTIGPSLEPSSSPSSTLSVVPSSQPSSSQTGRGCVERDNICAYTLDPANQAEHGSTSVCVYFFQSSKEVRSECVPNSELARRGPHDYLFGMDSRLILDCGCCQGDTFPFIPGPKIFIENESFCDPPICTPDDDDWTPCSDGNGDIVADNIKVCVTYKNGNTSTECTNPFFQTESSLIASVTCGSCPS